MKMTPPIGFNEQGQVIEEVVTTASRLPPQRIPWGAILAAGALALLAWQLDDDRPRRRSRRRR